MMNKNSIRFTFFDATSQETEREESEIVCPECQSPDILCTGLKTLLLDMRQSTFVLFELYCERCSTPFIFAMTIRGWFSSTEIIRRLASL